MAKTPKPKTVRAGSQPEHTATKLAANSVWWKMTGAEACKALVAWSDEAINANLFRASRAYRFASLFEGYTLNNLSGFGAEVNNDQIFDGLNVPVIRNKVRRLVMTVINKAFANDNPVPQYTTRGASYDQSLKAENIDDLMMTEFDQEQGDFSDIHELWRQGGTIATSATGRCYIFAFPGEENVEAEVDDSLTVGVIKDGQYGPVQTLVRSVWKDPEATAEKYPWAADRIMANIDERAAPVAAGGLTKNSTTSTAGPHISPRREVRIIQGWRCTVGKTKGKRIYCLKDGTSLLPADKGEWDKKRPPCAWWDYEKELSGEGGTPLTQTVYRMAMRQNEATHDMDRTQHETPQQTWLTQKGTSDGEAVKGQLQGAQGIKIVEIAGKPGDAVQMLPNPGLGRSSVELEQLYDNGMHDDTGIAKNQSSGSGQPGTTSGIQESLRASYLTENLADQTRRLVRARAVDTARIFLWALQEMIADKGSKFERYVSNGKKKLTPADLDLDESKYVTQIKAASDEKDSPKTRLQKAEQLMKDPTAQFTGADMVEMWKTNDIDRLTEQMFAIEEWIEEQHKRWLKSSASEMGKDTFYQSPSKWMRKEGLATALRLTTAARLWAEQEGAPPERIKYFDTFCDECVALIEAEERREAENKGNVRPAGQSIVAPVAAPAPAPQPQA